MCTSSMTPSKKRFWMSQPISTSLSATVLMATGAPPTDGVGLAVHVELHVGRAGRGEAVEGAGDVVPLAVVDGRGGDGVAVTKLPGGACLWGRWCFARGSDHLLPEGRSPQDTMPMDLTVSVVLTQAETVRGLVPTMPLKPLTTTSFVTPSNCSAWLNLPVTHCAGSLVKPISGRGRRAAGFLGCQAGSLVEGKPVVAVGERSHPPAPSRCWWTGRR